ncbi:MAG: hypothetical protein ACR2P4_07135 [Gammaproteobacteria bacterium]
MTLQNRRLPFLSPPSSSFRRTPESPFAFYEIPAFAGMTRFFFAQKAVL